MESENLMLTSNKFDLIIKYFGKLHSVYYFFVFLSSSYAAFDDQYIGARAYGMGNALTAIANQADGILINPASISNIIGQELSATTALLHLGLTDQNSIRQDLLAYANSVPQTGAIGFLWKQFNIESLYTENYVVIGTSKNILLDKENQKQIAIGSSVKLLSWNTAPTIGSNGKIIEDLPRQTKFSFDLGIIIRPSPNTPIALSIQNLNRPNIASNNSKVAENLPIVTSLGIGILSENFAGEMDLVFRQHEVNVYLGIEHQFDQGRFYLRGGLRLENLAWGTNLTSGVGYRPSNQVGIDYGLIFPIVGPQKTYGSHRVSVIYDF